MISPQHEIELLISAQFTCIKMTHTDLSITPQFCINAETREEGGDTSHHKLLNKSTYLHLKRAESQVLLQHREKGDISKGRNTVI